MVTLMIEIFNSDNLLACFIAERCERSDEHWVGKSAFFEAYKNYSLAKGEAPMPMNEVGKAMKAKPFVQDGRNKKLRFWKGLQVLETQPVEQKTADFPSVPDAIVSWSEEARLPVEDLNPPVSPTPILKRVYLNEEAVNALMLKHLFGTVETRRL